MGFFKKKETIEATTSVLDSKKEALKEEVEQKDKVLTMDDLRDFAMKNAEITSIIEAEKVGLLREIRDSLQEILKKG
jgi:hypothetical protein